MDKNLKVTLIMTAISVALVAAIVLVIMNLGKEIKEKEGTPKVVPKITEEYTSVTLNTLKEYYYHLFHDDNQVVYYKDSDPLLVYKDGIMYDDKIVDEEYEYNFNFKKYDVTSEGSDYCISNKSTKKTECFSEIRPIGNKVDSIDYLLLINDEDGKDKALYLLDPNNDKRIDLLKKDISYISNDTGEDYIIVEDYDYLSVCSNYNKCGLMSYDGKMEIEFVYDYLIFVNKNKIIAYKGNKVGVINYKNETVVPFDYDYLEIWGDYYVTVTNYKLSVLDSKLNKLVENIQIKETEEGEFPYNYFGFMNGKALYIVVEDEKNTIYHIDKKLLKQLSLPYNYEIVDDNKGNLKYFVFKYEKDGKIIFDFYDTDLTEYYKIEKEIKKNINYSTYISNIDKNDNYYGLNIDYDIAEYSQTYYVDLLNSKELTEYDALVKYFKNGYGFVLTDDKLKIYKEKELLEEFSGDFEYLDSYKFLKHSTYDNGSIVEVEFKKESREVSQ